MYPELSLETLTRDGIREGLYSVEDSFYHGGINAISQSRLKEYAKSPAHYKTAIDGASDDDNPMFTEGTAWHLALLEPDRFRTHCVIEPSLDKRTKSGKEEYARWSTENHGKLVIPADTHARIVEGVSAMRADKELACYITGGHSEVCAIAQHPIYKLWMKAKLDYWFPGSRFILDFKTTSSLEDFGRSIIKYGYIIQAPFYVDIVELILKQKVSGFAFLVVEKKKPYAYKVFVMTERTIEKGREMYERYLERHMQCVQEDSWPVYDELMTMWEPDEWFFRRNP